MIKNFKSTTALRMYLSTKNIKLLNVVTEGKCYLGDDKIVYKVLGIDGLESKGYNPDKIITEDDIKVDSFAFPKDLYIVNKELTGYSADYAGKDLFSSSNLNLKLVCKLDFEKFSNAYKVMKSDIDKLSDNKILMYDLPFNIVYDGDKFTGIDTCGYKKVDYDPREKNMESYNYAIEGIFRLCFNDFEDSNLNFEEDSIEEYLNKIENRLPNRARMYREEIKSRRK